MKPGAEEVGGVNFSSPSLCVRCPSSEQAQASSAAQLECSGTWGLTPLFMLEVTTQPGHY